MYRLLLTLSVSIIFFAFPKEALAYEYVLPYPSFMPGHPLYKVSTLLDRLEEWWSFGNLAKSHYYLSLADKKLVEAKTLFEYDQHLLALEALAQSDVSFEKANAFLLRAKEEGKDTSEKQVVFKNASFTHQRVLQKISEMLPAEFIWQPEFEKPTTLFLKESLESSMKKRNFEQ